MNSERNCSFLFLLQRHRLFIRPGLFFLLFFSFFGHVSFVTTTHDNIQFHSQVRLSQINVVSKICLKFKLYAALIECGRVYILFLGRQDIVNYWDFPSSVSRDCHKSLILKISGHGYWSMFVKLSLLDRLICFVDFFLLTPLALFYLLPLAICFRTVCLSTLLAALLMFVLPPLTLANSGTASSNKKAPKRFATGMT